jgi:hypothetical protein
MNLEFTKPQNLGSLLRKSSQSNFDLRSPSSFLVRSSLIATVLPQHQSTYSRGPESASIKIPPFRPKFTE